MSPRRMRSAKSLCKSTSHACAVLVSNFEDRGAYPLEGVRERETTRTPRIGHPVSCLMSNSTCLPPLYQHTVFHLVYTGPSQASSNF